MSEASVSAPLESPDRRWTWRLAVLFILVTLMSMVTVPWIVQKRIRALRHEIVAADPARTLVNRWQFALLREMSALNDLLLTGDSLRAQAYRGATEMEDTILPRLAPLVSEMGPEVVVPFATARTLSMQWHRRVNSTEVLRLRAEGRGALEIPRERRLFEEVIATTVSLDSAIVEATQRRRAEIRGVERTGLLVTFVMGIMAAIAGVVVLMLNARVRRYAIESERRRLEAADALRASARESEARARLMRGITHDVKNPLGAAKGYAELLALGVKAPVAPEQQPLVEGITRSVDSALAIIADLLDFARLDGGGVSVNRVEADLNALVREVTEDYQPAAVTAGHVMEVVAWDAPLVAYTDPVRIRQVLGNLISNAIKYTPAPGRIVVRAAASRRSPDAQHEDLARVASWATIDVSDTGPGIPADKREVVFNEFTRLDESSGVADGHGLGLAIARGLARRMGGDLTIADTAAGTTFVLWIPRREQN